MAARPAQIAEVRDRTMRANGEVEGPYDHVGQEPRAPWPRCQTDHTSRPPCTIVDGHTQLLKNCLIVRHVEDWLHCSVLNHVWQTVDGDDLVRWISLRKLGSRTFECQWVVPASVSTNFEALLLVRKIGRASC